MASFYLQPRMILRGEAALQAQKEGHALPIAGQKAVFLFAEMIEGHGSKISRSLYAVSDLKESADPVIREKLDILGRRRPDIGGLCFDAPLIMGILNVTPDSFSDGGLFSEAGQAVSQGKKLIGEGADILDIGGESTRPGAKKVDPEIEKKRVVPVFQGLASSRQICSIDSRNSAVMEAAVEAGAAMINDVTALTYDPDSLALAAERDVPVILMHSRIAPDHEDVKMSANPTYDNVCLEIYDYLEARIKACVAAGIDPQKIIIDPGIGFGKTFADNIALLKNISLFHGLGVPILVGLSRKRFIGEISGETIASKRDPGSISLSLEVIRQGVQMVRVHNVKDMRQALDCFGEVQA